MLNEIFGAARWTYNKCVEMVRNDDANAERLRCFHPKTGNSVNWQTFLRSRLLNKNSDALQENPWLSKIAYVIRDGIL